jgi:hypothetical protein
MHISKTDDLHNDCAKRKGFWHPDPPSACNGLERGARGPLRPTRSRNTSTRRALPIPASPLSSTTCLRPSVLCTQRSSSSPTSCSRPTRGVRPRDAPASRRVCALQQTSWTTLPTGTDRRTDSRLLLPSTRTQAKRLDWMKWWSVDRETSRIFAIDAFETVLAKRV